MPKKEKRRTEGLLVRLVAALLAVLLLSAVPAFASGGGGHGKKPAAEPVEQGPRIPSVSMPTLVSPVNIEGQLVRYAYIGVTLQLENENDKPMMMDKIPYIHDAFLRDVHLGASISLNGDPAVLDLPNLSARLAQVCAALVGPNIVKKVELRDAADDFK